MGIRKSAFDSVSGYDEELKCGEDVDLSLRLQAAGFRSAFIPGAKSTADPLEGLFGRCTDLGSAYRSVQKAPRSWKLTHLFPLLFSLFALISLSHWPCSIVFVPILWLFGPCSSALLMDHKRHPCCPSGSSHQSDDVFWLWMGIARNPPPSFPRPRNGPLKKSAGSDRMDRTVLCDLKSHLLTISSSGLLAFSSGLVWLKWIKCTLRRLLDKTDKRPCSRAPKGAGSQTCPGWAVRLH